MVGRSGGYAFALVGWSLGPPRHTPAEKFKLSMFRIKGNFNRKKWSYHREKEKNLNKQD